MVWWLFNLEKFVVRVLVMNCFFSLGVGKLKMMFIVE